MVLSRYCKQRIVQLYFERKVSYGRLAKVLAAEGLKVPKKTIWTTISKYKAHGTLSRLPGSGRRFKLTPEALAMIEAQMQADDETTATQLVKMLNAAGYDVSRSTIIRARRRLGWTFHGSRYCQMIRAQNKEKRIIWARANEHNTFDTIVWTDESMIQLENHRTFSYRKVGEAPRPKARAKHPYKVMVWAGISKRGATNIALLNCSVNSTVYQEVLRTHLLPFLRERLPNGRLQQDNAPCHVSKATQKFLEVNNISLFQTPPESPDCNPIKNLWHELKHYIRTTVKPRNKEELIQGIQTFWATVTPEKCCRYINHLKKVIPKVLEVHGEATGY